MDKQQKLQDADSSDEYESVYFDSDEEKPNTMKPSDEDLLYDEEADHEDEKWMEKKTENSDAVLACPMCFTLVCFDCQRHEKYHTQFRAMFVENVKVSKEKLVPQDHEPGETYYAVSCSKCDTRIAVMDQDEVFHFFNVIESS